MLNLNRPQPSVKRVAFEAEQGKEPPTSGMLAVQYPSKMETLDLLPPVL